MKKFIQSYWKNIISKKPTSINLRAKLFISLILLVVLSVFFITVVFYMVTSKTIEQRVSSYAFEIIQKTDENISIKLKQYEDITLQIISDNEIYNYVTDESSSEENNGSAANYNLDSKIQDQDSMNQNVDIRDKIYKLVGTKKGVYSITFILSNKIIFTNELLKDRTIIDKYNYIQALNNENGRPVWFTTIESSEMFASIHEPRAVINVGRSITSKKTGKNIGIVLLTINEDELYSSYKDIDVFKGAYSFIVNHNGSLISHSKRTLVLDENDQSIIGDIKNNKPGNIKMEMDGKSYIFIYENMSIQDWILVSAIPAEYLYADINTITNIVYIFIFIMIAIALLISFFISKRISDPIRRLIRAMKEVERGNLSIEVKQNSEDEIGILTHRFNRMLSEINSLIERVYQEESQKYEAVYKSLQAQITPHFLFNTLTSIKLMLEMEYSHQEILKITEALIQLLQAITNRKDAFITIEEELINVQNYVIIQNIRYNNKIDLIMDIPEAIKDVMLPTLIIQPIVENSIIHGFDFSVMTGKIEIHAEKKEKDILVTVSDNGMGIDRESIDKVMNGTADNHGVKLNRIGIANIHERLKLCYGKKYGITIESEVGTGTRVNILIPGKTIESVDLSRNRKDLAI